MPRTKISTLTATDFIAAKTALGLNTKQLAAALELSSPTITGYEKGNPIPVSTESVLNYVLYNHYNWLKAQPGVVLKEPMDVDDMLTQQNILNGMRPSPRPTTRGRLYHKREGFDATQYPPYRMTYERLKLYAGALVAWNGHVLALQREHSNPLCQFDYEDERACIEVLAAALPSAAPYDVTLWRSHWYTVSRAIRHLARYRPAVSKPALSLYSHWKKHRFSGFPVNRSNNKR